MKINDITIELYKEGFNEIYFPLNKKFLKPIFISHENSFNGGFSCMLDSGAAIPVWCTGVITLIGTFPTALYQQGLKSILSGFGKGFQVADVYKIPKLVFRNDKGSFMIFNNFYLPVIEGKSFGADLIFPSAMLKNSFIALCNLEHGSLEKGLLIQSQTMAFETHYTYRYLKDYAVDKIKEKCKTQGISIFTRFIGGEGEFKEILVQENDAEHEI